MSTIRRILIEFAHPAIRRSRVNRRLVEAVRDLADVTVHDLYEAYPEFDIDVQREQALLASHDVVVLQHPLYWYSTPAILKEWQDLVLQHGWAYGRDGRALRGKLMMSAITAGGGEESYRRSGSNHFTIGELLAPIEQTAALCGMRYMPPFIVYGTHDLGVSQIEVVAREYRRTIEAIRDGEREPPLVADSSRPAADPGARTGG